MIYNFFELAADFTLPPAEAIAFFRDKGLTQSFSYLDMVGEEHNAAFTVAKMMDNDLLVTVRDKLDQALAEGKTLADFKKELIPTLQSAGWWGKKDVVDPKTGRVVSAQLGSASRLETIFRTNLQSAYAAGHWQTIQEQADAAPYLLYDAVDDNRTRPDHAALDGTVLPVGSPFWDTHYPPNGYNCRCGVIQLDEDELAEYGLTKSAEPDLKKKTWTNPRTGKGYIIPEGTDPQFAHNPGKWRLAKLDELAIEKAAKLKAAEAAAMATAQGAIEKARTASRIEAQASKALKDLQKQETQGAFQKQYEKVKQRAAQAQIDQAIADKTPYLAKTIKKVSATKAAQGMTPAEILAKAQEQVATLKLGDQVSKYKKAKIAGKEPPEPAVTAYQSLPPEKKAAVDQEIDVKSGNYQAQLQIDEYQSGTGYSYEKKAIKKLKNQGALDGLDAKGQLQAIQEAANAQKQKDQQAKALKAYKANLIAGKPATENQAAAFNALTDAEQTKLLQEVTDAKGTPKPDTTPAPKVPQTDGPDMDNVVKVGNQQGSNPGGFYQDTTTGQQWYIKTPDSEDNAKNEVLAGKLYQAAGVEVPNLAIVTFKGKPGIASQIIDGLESRPDALKAGTVANVGENFAVDAWLANWDVVGLGFDNLLVKANRAIRVDTGGALRYRAQGGTKGAAFGKTVDEIDSLRDPTINPQAAAVFGNVTDEQIRAGVARIEKITDAQIDELVDQFGPANVAQRKNLATILKARRDNLVKRYPPITKPPAGKQTAKYKKALAIAKQNAADEASATVQDVNDKIVTAIKGLAMQTNAGDVVREKDRVRVQEAMNAVSQIDELPLTPEYKAEVQAYYQAWIDDLETAIAGENANWTGGKFDGLTIRPDGIDESRIKVDLSVLDKPTPYTAAEAKKIITEAIGDFAGNAAFPQGAKSAANLKGVPDGHLRAMYLYTLSHYREINRQLYTKTATPETKRYRDLLNQAIDLATPYKGRVSRGMSLDSSQLADWVQRMTEAQDQGKPVRLLGFTSTSKGNQAAFGGNVLIQIESQRGVWVKPVSGHPGENEVLMPAGSTHLIKDITQKGGKTYITLTEIQADATDGRYEFQEAADAHTG